MGQKLSRRYSLQSNEPRQKSQIDQSSYRVAGALNPLFGVFELAARPHRRRERDLAEAQCPSEFCLKVLELVQQGDSSEVEFLLRDPPIQPTSVVKDHIASHYSVGGLTSLHYACRNEDLGVVEVLVEFCKDGRNAINAQTKHPDVHQFTPLHYAVRTGNLQLVQVLLKHPHIDLDVKDDDGCTPLHYACHFGFSSIVMAIVLKGADFCIANNEKDYPLHIAASEQRKEIFSAIKSDEELVEKLHRNTEFISQQDADGNTLLHLAIDAEISDAVDLCLMLGFDLRMENKQKMISLHIAARRGNTVIAQQLLEKEKESEGQIETFVRSRNRFFATPLYIAAKFGQANFIELLLKNGAELEEQNNLGFTPLLAAIRYTNLQCVRVLLSAGADILTRDKRRNYNALLWAVEVQRQNILAVILDHAQNQPDLFSAIWREKDLHGNTAHHIAAKARNLNILETLVERNSYSLEEKNSEGCTPFHTAVKEGKLGIVGYIVSHSAGSIHSLDGNGNTGLHLAAESGHKDIVERLVTIHDFGTSVCTRNNNGHTPVHLASKNGHQLVLEFLLEHSPKDTAEILDNNHATALYLACKNGHVKCVEVLLHWNAMVTYSYQQRNMQKKESCLEAAIDNDHLPVVTVIINSDHWRQALQYCRDPDLDCGETPLRKLIKKMPVAAKLTFDRCVAESKEPDKKTGAYIRQVEYNYEFLEDFQDLFTGDGPRFSEAPASRTSKPTISALIRQVQVTSQDLRDPLTPAFEPGELEVKANPSAIQSSPAHFQHHEPTARPCDPYHAWGPKNYQHKSHPLHLMVLFKRQELLKHNLVASFIHYKWNLFGRYIYYPNIITYILLMLMLTTYMYLRFDYSKALSLAICESIEDCSVVNESFNRFLNNCTFTDYNVTDQDTINSLHSYKVGLTVCACIIIVNCLVRILFETIQIIHHRGVYFTSYINYLELFLYIATMVFVTDFRLVCLLSWQWQLGAICIFLSWINFILFLSEQPMVGIYVVMFQDIIKTFLRMAPMSILLILAFGQPFFMLLSTVTSPPPQQFVTFPYSLLKTIIMTAGEFETDPIFFSTPSVVEYPGATYFLWLVFLIIMPVLLQNMLVGLAVDDIKSVQEKAALKKQSLQIEFILDVMSQLPKPVIRYINHREYTQTWGKSSFDKFKKWLSGEAWKPEIKTNNTEDVFLKLEKMTDSMVSLEHRLVSLTEQTLKLERMMLHFAHEQERYLEPARQNLLLGQRRSLFRSQPAFTTTPEFRPGLSVSQENLQGRQDI